MTGDKQVFHWLSGIDCTQFLRLGLWPSAPATILMQRLAPCPAQRTEEMFPKHFVRRRDWVPVQAQSVPAVAGGTNDYFPITQCQNRLKGSLRSSPCAAAGCGSVSCSGGSGSSRDDTWIIRSWS